MRIIEPKTPEDIAKYYKLRYEILRKPWNQPEKSTKDELEDQSVHILMLNEKDEAIATGRLQLNNDDEGQIRSMAVRKDCQHQGYGSQVMKYIEMKARKLNLKKIILDAREPAVPFYKRHGYEVIGDSYVLFGKIPHFRMSKDLSHI